MTVREFIKVLDYLEFPDILLEDKDLLDQFYNFVSRNTIYN